MTLAEHLAELRSRLVRIVLAVSLGAIVGWVLFEPAFHLLSQPYCDVPGAYRPDGECQLIVTRVLEAFSVRVQMTLIIGLFIAAPVLFHQLWRFITPGLTQRERRYTLPFVLLGQLMFLAGAAFAFYIIPKGLGILLRLGGEQITTLLSAGEYFSFILRTIVAFGLVFQVPLIIVFLALVGLVDTGQLRRFRPYAVVGNCIIAAIVTPTVDAVTMLFMAGPMILLYEAAIVVTWLIERTRRRREAEGLAS
jgi:sec-independent protein translocase protein TatC